METNGIGINVTLSRDQWRQCAAAAEHAMQSKVAARLRSELEATAADQVTVEVQDAGLNWLAARMAGTETGQILSAIVQVLKL